MVKSLFTKGLSLRERIRGVRRRSWVIFGVVSVLVIAAGTTAIAWTTTRQSAAAAPITQTVTASLETLEQSVEATGTLTPAVQESVNFLPSGTVTSVSVVAGDTVTVGQQLATVDTLQADANLLQAQANLADAQAELASAQAELASAQEDADGTASSDAKIAAKQAAINVAAAAVTTAEQASAGVTLTAPVAGLVTSVGIEVGDSVTGTASTSSSSGSGGSGSGGGASGSSMSGAQTQGSSATSTSSSTTNAQFSIVSTDSWSVSVSLGETEIGLIEADDQVELETDDGTQLFGVVSEIGRLPSTDSGSAAYPVSINVTGETSGLFDGTSVTATIIYERRSDVLTVPSSAVTTAEDGSSTVLKVDADGNTSVQPVTIGEVSGDLTEITEGLEEGDQVQVTVVTPGEGNTGDNAAGMNGSGMPDMSGGGFPGGEMPSGGFPGGGEMPSGGFPGGGGQ